MTADRVVAWRRRAAPATVSVLLGVVAGILVNQATAARAGMSAILGAVTAVTAWALWEGWRAVRGADGEGAPAASVVQIASHVRGRLLGWRGPLAERPLSIRQQVAEIEHGGEVIGVEARGDATGQPDHRQP
jgi:hypothetical protein